MLLEVTEAEATASCWQQGRTAGDFVASDLAAEQWEQSVLPGVQLAQRAGSGNSRAAAAVRITAQRVQNVGRRAMPTMLELLQVGWGRQVGFGWGPGDA